MKKKPTLVAHNKFKLKPNKLESPISYLRIKREKTHYIYLN